MNSSSIWNAVKKANAGTVQQIDPKIWPGPDPEVFARSFQLQPWTTIRGNASATFPVRSVAQDEGAWIDLSTYADAAFWIEVAGVNNPTSGIVSLNLETSPVKDEPYFKPVAPPLTLVPQAVNGSPTPYLVRTVRTPTTAPLAKYTRWRLSVSGGATGTWDATFRIRGAAGKTSFMTPTQLQGCIGWFRADLGITLSSGNVTTWVDQSSKGYVATAPAGREPPYNVAGHQINGQPTLFFDPTGAAGTEKMIQLPSGAFSNLSLTAFQAFVVHRRITATEPIATRTGFWRIGGGAGTPAMPGSDGNVYDDCASTTDQNCGPPAVTLTTPQVYEVQATSSSWNTFANGKTQFSRASNTFGWKNPPALGGNDAWPNFYYGDWAEAIFYSRLLSTAERALLIAYLNGRYGLNAK
jgi:hypothetical protein